MREYAKIDTLLERGPDFKVTDTLKRPIFADISKWIVTEKIDGMNIRIGMTFGADKVEINGRSDNAQIPADLAAFLYKTFTPALLARLFLHETQPGTQIVLFGEGYGPGIQKGGGDYRADKGFVLFDATVEVGGQIYWQDDATVTVWASLLEIPRVPVLGEWSLPEIMTRVRDGIPSACAIKSRMAEGIVARTREPLFDQRSKRFILKLKTKDYAAQG